MEEKENKEMGLAIQKQSLARQNRVKAVLYVQYIYNGCALQSVKWTGVHLALRFKE